MDRIVVLDFGSQYSHLICRRIREFSVYAELVPYDITLGELKGRNPRGIILSGGPSSVYSADAPVPAAGIFDLGLPVLGICYGHQVIVDRFGGRIKRANREYGSSLLTVDDDGSLLGGIGRSVRAWMSHGDEAEQIPPGFQIIGHTSNARAAAIAGTDRPVYGIQFHPEVVHTQKGTEILKNFVLKICGARQDWTMEAFVDRAVGEISGIQGRVLCGVSGGIDSTVAALLIHRAIGDRLHGVFIDNGLLRQDEGDEIEAIFRDNFHVNFTAVSAAERFLEGLRGVADPEAKRKAVGEEFVRVFSEFAERNGPFSWLAQGTLYPDVIESGVSKGPAAVIKSHHNVGGLPDWLDLKVLEPLRDLYKDEVREVARILGVPDTLYPDVIESGVSKGPAAVIKSHHNVGGLPDWLDLKVLEPLRDLYKDEVREVARILGVPDRIVRRHPFPGPGLAVRIIGEVTPAKLRVARTASRIVEDVLLEAGVYDDVWQAYAAVGDDRAVGVVGDERRYGSVVMVRVVNSVDAMTADWTRLSHETLERISNRITNEIEDVTWVTYTISSKPPATIEPQ
jgi:GMP synthase (glutamine-hydrolysing)